MPPKQLVKQLTLTELFFRDAAAAPKIGLKRTLASNDSSPAIDESAEKKRSKPMMPSASENEIAIENGTASTLEQMPPEEAATLPNDGWPTPELSPLFSTLVESGWRSLLSTEFKKDYVGKICHFLQQQYNKGATVFPPRDLIFNAFNLTPFNDIRVVLIGQDPYHNLRQAHGLCFSVPENVQPPPSLKNIYKELAAEYPTFVAPNHGTLVSWAEQGVFLLNATLTVEAHKPNSHSKIGWQQFTDAVIRLISTKSTKGVVFLLWGGFAQRKEALVDKKKHRVIKAAHPSPFSATKFFGCKCFSKTNAQLTELGHRPIDWHAL